MHGNHPIRREDPRESGSVESSLRLAVNRREAAAMLGISERLLWTYTNAGTIPHARIGTRVLYPVSKLRAWLDEQSADRHDVRRNHDPEPHG